MFAFQLSAFRHCTADDKSPGLHQWIRMTRPIRGLVMMTVTTLANPPHHLTSKKTIWIINRRSFILVRRDRTSHYALQGFHCQRNGAVLILSLHALRFQIPEICLRQWHNHCSNTKCHPSSTKYSSRIVHHPPGHWCFPPSLVETRIFHNLRPVVMRMFPNTKGYFWGSERFMEAILLTKNPSPIISDDKYSMVAEAWKLAIEA